MIGLPGNLARTWSKAVVTGAGGFIGRNLVQLLRDHGVPVVGIGRHVAPTVDVISVPSQLGALESVLDDATVLFHLAGSADVRGSLTDPVIDFRDNVVTAINVLECARAAKCRLVFPSTGSVYHPDAPLPLREDAPVRPRSPYAAAKLSIESYCYAYYSSYGLDVTVARIFTTIGPGMRRLAIYDFVKQLERDPRRLVLFGDGKQTRDYLHVHDVARALELIAHSGQAGTVYNVASGDKRTIREVADAVVATMGLRDVEVSVDGSVSPAETYRMEADVTRLRQLGFTPKATFEQALLDTVQSLQSNPRETVP